MEASSCSISNSHTRLILKRYMELQNTRLSLLQELETILDSYLSNSNNQSNTNLLTLKQQLTEDTNPAQKTQLDLIQSNPSSSSCRHEYKDININQEDYVEQVLSISTSGFLEIKDEVKLLMEMLESNLKRSDLFNLLNKIEDLETKKISEHLRRNLLRRKEKLEECDFSDAINSHKKKINLLSESIADLMNEVQAEIVELCEKIQEEAVSK